MSAPTTPTILIAGGGPSALFFALRLAQSNIPVTVFERDLHHADIPKAYAFMPVLFPDFKKAGIWDDLIAAAAKGTGHGINYRLTSTKEVIATMPSPAPGMPVHLLLSQFQVLGIMMKHLRKFDCARVEMGHEVVGVMQDEAGVRATVRGVEGAEEKVFEGAYLVGADGGKSSVRKLCDISFGGVTLPQQLVATDIYYPFEQYGWSGANFMIDEKYYGLMGPIDDHGLWRVSFGMTGDPDMEEVDRAIPDWLNKMIPGEKPVEYKLDKRATYRAQQLCAGTFRKGRVLLIGDAAHLTNPYIGMGLATGLLDASSLAECLTSIIQREASDSLLDAWATNRRNIFKSFIDPMSRAAFASVQDPDAKTFPQRHPLLRKALEAKAKGEKPNPPPVRTDVTVLEGFVW